MSCGDRVRQEPEWEAVLAEVRDEGDALVLYEMFCDGTVFANDLPVDALDTGVAILSQRGFAGFLAEHLTSLGGGSWSYLDLYAHREVADPKRTEALIARCCDAGVDLHHRPDLPTPWRVVLAQLASDADLAAFAILARDYSANIWPIELEVDLVLPAGVDVEATPEQIADLIARCRDAGVVLRPL